jgi:hypothetical protein
MNYVCAVYGVLVLIITVDWLTRARKSFRGQTSRHEEVAQRGGRALGSSAARDGDDVDILGVRISSKYSQ